MILGLIPNEVFLQRFDGLLEELVNLAGRMGIVQALCHHHSDREIGQKIEEFLLDREKHFFLLLPLETHEEHSGISNFPTIAQIKCQWMIVSP